MSKENGADRIADRLGQAADAVDVVNGAGVKTGKASFYIRLGQLIASLFGKRR